MLIINEKAYKTYEFDEIDKNKYHGFIYVTVNKVNGKKYVGQHTKWNKKYVGSGGKYFNHAKKKYGLKNFERHIIDLATSQEELNEKETFYINEEFKAALSEDWYNLKDGSQSGGNPLAGFSEEEMERIRKMRSEQTAGEGNPMFGNGYKLQGDKNGMRTHEIDFSGEKNPFYGKNHSEESRKKMKEFQQANAKLFHFKQPCKLTYPDGKVEIFDSSKELVIFFKEKFDLSKPIVMKLLKTKEPYNPRWKGFEAKGIVLERVVNK